MEIVETENKEVLKDTLNHKHLIWFGSTGSGKTVGTERRIQNKIDKGWLIALIDNKEKLETAYSQFPVEEQYHLKLLEKQGESFEQLKQKALEGNTKAERMLANYVKPVKVYHPFTYARDEKNGKYLIGSGKIPETHFLTIPITDIDDDLMYFLFEKDFDQNKSFEILQEAIQNLKPHEGIYDLMRIVSELVKKKTKTVAGQEIIMPDKDNWGLESGAAGTTQQREDISLLFKPFQRHGFLSERKNSLNIDFRELLQDTEHIHVLSTRYLKGNKKLRMFVKFWWMKQILELAEKISHPPILFGYPEAQLGIPRKPEGFMKVSSRYFKEKAQTIRVSGVDIQADTQTIHAVHTDVKELFNVAMFGNIGTQDIDEIKKVFQMSKYDLDDLKVLPKGKFFLYGKTDRGEVPIKMPTHAHAEEGDVYDEHFRRVYPNRMRNYHELVISRKKHFDEILDKINTEAQTKLRKLEEEAKRKEDEEVKVDKLKQEVATLKTQIKTTKTEKGESRETILKKLWTEATTPRERSYRKLAEKLTAEGFPIGKSQVQTLIEKMGLSQNSKKNDTPSNTE